MSSASAVEALLFAALDKPPAERETFLASACAGNAELRHQVDRLLKAHANVGDFLNQPVVGQLAAAAADDTQALAPATDGPDAGPGTGDYVGRTEGGAIDEENPLAFLQSPTRADSLGRLGHYEILEILGKGGFGIVFRAFDEQLQRVVAIKVLAPEMAGTALACKRFLREARSSARVRHENVVQIYTVEEAPLPYLVMEFVPGETLQQRLDRTGPMEATEVVRLGRQLAEGLAAAHATGLIHRDIKPGNILIEAGPNQHIKITDFGLARTTEDVSLTQSGVVAGTPMFMSPEQANAGPLDHRTDLFSLGSVLYTMCCGRPPFRAPNTLAVIKRVIDDTPRPIREIIPETPAWLCDLIGRLHAKKADDRLATAREVADLLGQGLAAPTSRPWFQRRSLVAAIVFLLLGVTEATGVTNVRGTVARLFAPEVTPEIPKTETKPTVPPDPQPPTPSGPWKPSPQQKDWLDNVAKEPLTQQLALLSRKMAEENKLPLKLVFEPQNGPPTRCVVAGGTAQVIWPLLVLPLQALDLTATAVTDFTPLARLPLTELTAHLIVDNVKSETALKSIVTLKTVNGRPAAAYWVERAALRKDIDDMVRQAPGLSLKNRQEWFNSALRKLNPKWTGQSSASLATDTANGLLTLSFAPGQAEGPVFDLSPVRALGVEAVYLQRTHQVCDLSPLAQSKVQVFSYARAFGSLRDLTPLAGLPLRELDLTGANGVTDLSPLAGMKLHSFQAMPLSSVTDVKVLLDMPLTTLALPNTITDLRPFKAMKLTSLGCSTTDLTPLAGLPLESLSLRGARPADLTPLTGMKLKHYASADLNSYWHWFRSDYEADEKLMRAMPLVTVNYMPAATFWTAYDADRKALQEFVSATARLTPTEAVTAVKAALKKQGWNLDDNRIENGAVVEVKLAPLPGAKYDLNPLGPLQAFPQLGKITLADNNPFRWPNLAPLMKLPIENIVCTPTTVAGNAIILRQLPTLKTINNQLAGTVLRDK